MYCDNNIISYTVIKKFLKSKNDTIKLYKKNILDKCHVI